MPPKNAAPSAEERKQGFFQAILSQKLEPINAALRAGGITLETRDGSGHSPLMVAAARGLDKSLKAMLVLLTRGDEAYLELTDDAGRTALMMAAANGHLSCCQLLCGAGAAAAATCEKGLTAVMYAERRSHAAAAEFLRGEDPAAIVAKAAKAAAQAKKDEDAADAAEAKRAAMAASAASQRASVSAKAAPPTPARPPTAPGPHASAPPPPPTPSLGACPAATWPEVDKAIRESLSELAIERPAAIGHNLPVPIAVDGDAVITHDVMGDVMAGGLESGGAWLDPALWHATSVNRLRIKLGPPVTPPPAGAPIPALTSLPGRGLANLTALLTLVVSGNALTSLPDVFGSLPLLRVLEADSNALTALPPSLAMCSKLEVVALSFNQIHDVSPLGRLTNLTSLKLDANKLTSLDPPLCFGAMPRLGTLSAAANPLATLSASLGELIGLTALNLSGCRVVDLPTEMHGLKKLVTVQLEGNPLGDPKVVKILKTSGTPAKELCTYLKKLADSKPRGGGKKGKKGAKKGGAGSDDDDDDDDAPAAPTAPAPTAPVAPIPVATAPVVPAPAMTESAAAAARSDVTEWQAKLAEEEAKKREAKRREKAETEQRLKDKAAERAALAERAAADRAVREAVAAARPRPPPPPPPPTEEESAAIAEKNAAEAGRQAGANAQKVRERSAAVAALGAPGTRFVVTGINRVIAVPLYPPPTAPPQGGRGPKRGGAGGATGATGRARGERPASAPGPRGHPGGRGAPGRGESSSECSPAGGGESSSEVRFPIPGSAAGLVIGRAGSTIAALQSEFGVRIRLESNPESRDPPATVVAFGGAPAALAAARARIEGMVAGARPRPAA